MQTPTPKQWQALWVQLGRPMRLLSRLRTRLERRGYVPADPYYRAVQRAYDAVHGLAVQTHYKGVRHGAYASDERDRDARLWAGDGI